MIATATWDGQTPTEYVGDRINLGNGWKGQDLVATRAPGTIEYGRQFIHNNHTLKFFDEAERKHLATSPHVQGTYKIFTPRERQALTPPPPQGPSQAEKDAIARDIVMRHLGFG